MSAGGGGYGGGYGNSGTRWGSNYIQPGFGNGTGSPFVGQPGMMYPQGGGFGGSVGNAFGGASDMPTMMGGGGNFASPSGGYGGGYRNAGGGGYFGGDVGWNNGRDPMGNRPEDYAGGMSPWGRGPQAGSPAFNALPNLPGATPLRRGIDTGPGSLYDRMQQQKRLSEMAASDPRFGASTVTAANAVANGYNPYVKQDGTFGLTPGNMPMGQPPNVSGMTEQQRRDAMINWIRSKVPNFMA